MRAAWAPCFLTSAFLLAGGCATTGSTFRSGVGDRVLEHPPYYAGKMPPSDGAVALLPMAWQRGAAQEAFFDPPGGPDTPLGILLSEMNAFVDTLVQSWPRIAPSPGTPPDVMFGCVPEPGGDCEFGDTGSEPGHPRMLLRVGRPSPEWTAGTAASLADAGAGSVLVLTLEVGQYLTRQRNILGSKEVELGSGYAQPVPWLSALDAPVPVLQITGALVGPDGRAVRIGAEGLYARRTGLLEGSIGLRALITDEEAERVRSLRRDDLPGQPLVWQVALRRLVAELTGPRSR